MQKTLTFILQDIFPEYSILPWHKFTLNYVFSLLVGSILELSILSPDCFLKCYAFSKANSLFHLHLIVSLISIYIKMKSPIILTALLSISLLSCAKETPQVKHKSNMSSSKENLKNIQVVNEEDPICHMKTAEFLKDTAIYKNNTYGFCSAYCKDEFKKSPEKYAKK